MNPDARVAPSASHDFDPEAPPTNNDKATSDRSERPKAYAPPAWFYAVPITLFAIATSALVVGSIALARANQNGSNNVEGPEGEPMKPSSPDFLEGSKTIDQIIERGMLRCGVRAVPLFAEIDGTGVPQGLDVDLCRAVAAALFGRESYEEHLELYFLRPQEDRFAVLTNKNGSDDDEPRIDLLAAIATHTMDRDVWSSHGGTGLSFSTPYLYDGLKFAGTPEYVACADQFDSTGACEDLKICVYDRTTTQDYIDDVFPLDNIEVLTTVDSFFEGFSTGRCNVIAADGLIANGALGSFYEKEDAVLGESQLTREPISLVTRDDDPRWSDFVNWVIQGLQYADEQDITQSEAVDTIAPTPFFGDRFESMFVDAVASVGNFGEIYDRHILSALGPREGGLNSVNDGSTGLVFSHPFGALKNMGPSPMKGSTLETIKTRGHLNCGISRRAGFGELAADTLQWKGFDVDYCKALAAAIFDGSVDHIVYHVLPATGRFEAQDMGDVDVLSRITTYTLERDVFEPTTMQGFMFSQPVFYDGLSFGGVPTFVECADNLRTDDGCADLRICVNDGTTTVIRTSELFPSTNIVVKPTGEEALAGLVTGECNAIAGGSHDLARASVESVGYSGEYAIGSNRFSKEPLALVTRQDDAQWSDFVYWTVASTFYAEEMNITSTNSEEMPTTNLFGPLYTHMMIDAVRAVGNLGDIYSRNVESLVPRGGLNLLNENPLGPQMYPLPGINRMV